MSPRSAAAPALASSAVDDDALRAGVTAAVRAVDGFEACTDVALERLSGGASRQTWLVEPRWDGGSGDDGAASLVLQVARPGAPATSLPFATEARLLRAAAAAGVPVPTVLAASGLDGAEPVDGRPWMLTAHVAGETIARRILRDEPFAAARARLVADCGRALAAVHRIDPAQVEGLRASDPVTEAEAILDLVDEPHPVLELALVWLGANRPAPTTPEPRVVHGDFRLGNLIVDDGLAAAIDWELAHLGDPAEDLGWLCVKAWRFGAPGVVAGLGDVGELLAAYADAGGRAIDPEVLRWWLVAGTLRWGAICMVQSHSHLSGVTRNVELAAIGRRVCETELDLLELLGVATAETTAAAIDAAPQSTALPTDVHARPTVDELIEAVGEFLDGPVRDRTDGQVAFHARVAARALDVVRREVALAPAQAERHAIRLAALGVADERALAAAIRSGALEARADAVEAALLATTVDRLLVANPGYLGIEPERGGAS